MFKKCSNSDSLSNAGFMVLGYGDDICRHKINFHYMQASSTPTHFATVRQSPIYMSNLLVPLLIGRRENHKLEVPESTVHSYVIFGVQ